MIETAAGVGMALIASEHFFSSMLTSPMTTKRFFADTEEGIADTEKALKLAVYASLVAGGVLAILIKSAWPLVTTAAICGFYWWEYHKALGGEI